jgi:molybdate transport system substrate-binding protein
MLRLSIDKKVNILPRRINFKRSLTVLLLSPMLILIISGSCSPATSKLSVFAAAGTKPAIDELSQSFEERHGVKLEVNYGGGGEVLSQMALSRSGDIYVAPEQRFMETAMEKQVIDPETIKNIAYIIPVIAIKKGNPQNIATLTDLARPGIRVAITRPETTLLGKYTPEIFAKAGLAEEIGKNIVTEAARPDNLLTMLVMGQVDAGIIWHFYEVQAPDQIDVIFLPPEQLTGIGEMQVAVSVYSHDKGSAQRFIDFMTSSDGRAVFRKHGYIVGSEEVKQYWH